MKTLTKSLAHSRILIVGGSPSILTSYGFHNHVSIEEIAQQYPHYYPVKSYNNEIQAIQQSSSPSTSTSTSTSTSPSNHSPITSNKNNTNQDELNKNNNYNNNRIDAVFILRAPDDWGESLQILCDVIRSDGLLHPHPSHSNSNAALLQPLQHLLDNNSSSKESKQRVPIYLCNPDFVYQDEHPDPRFTLGAFQVCLEALYKVIIFLYHPDHPSKRFLFLQYETENDGK